MPNGNSNGWKIAGLLLTVVAMVVAGSVSYGMFYGGSAKDIEHIHERIQTFGPDIKKNSEFRISATETIKNLDEKVGKNTEAVQDNTKVQQQILIELQK